MATNRRERGLNLTELLVVIFILIAISLVLLVFPVGHSKMDAKRGMVRLGLKQSYVAMTLYQGEHDDKFPLDWKGMGFKRSGKFGGTLDDPPSYPASWAEPLREEAVDKPNFKKVSLSYLMIAYTQKALSMYSPRYPFDPDKDYVLCAPFMRQDSGGTRKFFAIDHDRKPIELEGQDYRILVAKPDGAIKWDYYMGVPWQVEYQWFLAWGGQGAPSRR